MDATANDTNLQTARSLPSHAVQRPIRNAHFGTVPIHFAARGARCCSVLAMLHSSAHPAESQRAVLAGGVTVWVGKCAKLGFSIMESQDIAFFFF